MADKKRHRRGPNRRSDDPRGPGELMGAKAMILLVIFTGALAGLFGIGLVLDWLT